MNEFNTNKNKEMLWNLLLKQGKFNNLPADYNPQQLFEKHISQVEIKSGMNTPLVNLNKSFLSSFLGEINMYTTNPQDIKKQQADRFNSILKEKQDSFDDAMKLKTPEAIDFSDKNEDTPIGDIERLIEEQRAKRNLEIPKAPQTDERSVQDWLSGNSSTAPIPIGDMNNGGELNAGGDTKSKNITIGDTVSNPQNTIIHLQPPVKEVKKSVKWEDSVAKAAPPLPSVNDMLSNVQETKPINTKSIEAALIKILKNQEYMINAIHDLQDRI